MRSMKEIAEEMGRRHEVRMIVPAHDFRGKVPKGTVFNFVLERVDTHGLRFNGPYVYLAIRNALRRFHPDVVILAYGNLFKPYFFYAAEGYPTITINDPYQLICPMSVGLLLRHGKVCPYNAVKYPGQCATCPDDKMRILKNTGPFDRDEFFRSLRFLFPLYHRLLCSSLSKPQLYVVPSKFVRSRLAEIVPNERITIIPFGVDPETFKPNSGREKGPFRIYLPGRVWDPAKGLGVVLRAAEILARKCGNFKVIIRGRTPPGFERDRYPFVSQLPWGSDSELADTYSSSDVVVVPSLWAEPFGLTALEGMSAGVPVIASNHGGLSETVVDGLTGFLFKPGDANALANKLEFLVRNPELRAVMGKNGRRRVLERYTWKHIVDQYEAAVRSLVTTEWTETRGK